jgi:hypothetical protein
VLVWDGVRPGSAPSSIHRWNRVAYLVQIHHDIVRERVGYDCHILLPRPTKKTFEYGSWIVTLGLCSPELVSQNQPAM